MANNITRTTSNPSFVYSALCDGTIIGITTLFSYFVVYNHDKRALVKPDAIPADELRTFILNISYDSIYMTIAVFLLCYVAIYQYWLRPIILNAVSDMRWTLMKKKHAFSESEPTCIINGGDGWHMETLSNGKSLVACFAYDGTLTIIDTDEQLQPAKAAKKWKKKG